MNHTTPNHFSHTSNQFGLSVPSVSDILSNYRFSRYEYRTLFTPAGRLVQASMLIQHPTDPNDRFIVMANYETGEWTVQCPRRKNHLAPLMIEAVRARVAVNRSQRCFGD